MFYVYLLKSIKNPEKTYIGYTTNLKERIKKHNEGGSIYTKDDRPWKLVSYHAFDEEYKALSFEKYIKTGSGHAFAKNVFGDRRYFFCLGCFLTIFFCLSTVIKMLMNCAYLMRFSALNKRRLISDGWTCPA